MAGDLHAHVRPDARPPEVPGCAAPEVVEAEGRDHHGLPVPVRDRSAMLVGFRPAEAAAMQVVFHLRLKSTIGRPTRWNTTPRESSSRPSA